MATKQEKIDALLKEMRVTLDTPTKEEFLALLKKHGIDYDEKYLWN